MDALASPPLSAPIAAARDALDGWLARAALLDRAYRDGLVRARVPEGLRAPDEPIDDLVEECLPRSSAALEAASRSLFFSLPVAFDPAESVGCYLATVDKDERGEPYRFLDMGALIATQACGENDPRIVAALLRDLPFVVGRYAHSEYQTALSLRFKAALGRIAPRGTPRHFVVNTGAEAVENAIKAVLLHRVRTTGEKTGGFIISFDGAFHGRTLGALAVTHRKKARTGFPTFEWPQVPFPSEDPAGDAASARREERTLRAIRELIVTGGHPRAEGPRHGFARDMQAIDAFLERVGTPGEGATPTEGTRQVVEAEVAAWVAAERARVHPEVLKRARRTAAVLLEPIQGEGGVRAATARFHRRLRLLTRLYDVPLVYDEVQTGWGACGRLWAHELFSLPAPPDVVTWAKKAQNGVLFVSEELATFFQEEKKFNTTWEGEPAGMLRLLALLERDDLLPAVARTGALARAGLERLAREHPTLLGGVRGAGVMLAIDVARPDLRDALRDRAFRRGLLLLPAGERTLRLYPRYDTPPASIDEAISLLGAAVDDLQRAPVLVLPGPKVRPGELEVPLECADVIDLDAARFREHRAAILDVEIGQYGSLLHYPATVQHEGRRPLLQYPVETLEATIAGARSIGVALRDGISGRIVSYALGGPLESFDETGVASDPHHGEGSAFYLQATATLPSVANEEAVEARLLDALRDRARAAGYSWISALIEQKVQQRGPAWLSGAAVLRVVEDYLRSGLRFVYVQAEVGREGR